MPSFCGCGRLQVEFHRRSQVVRQPVVVLRSLKQSRQEKTVSHFVSSEACNKKREKGSLLFSQEIPKILLKVKWKSNFPENSSGNCGLPPEVVLFFALGMERYLLLHFSVSSLSSAKINHYSTVIPTGLF